MKNIVIKVDGSYKPLLNNWGSYGGIVLENGKHIAAFAAKIKPGYHMNKSERCEFIALLRALKWLDKNTDAVGTIESDCEPLIKAINNEIPRDFEPDLWEKFTALSERLGTRLAGFKWISKRENKAAHDIAVNCSLAMEKARLVAEAKTKATRVEVIVFYKKGRFWKRQNRFSQKRTILEKSREKDGDIFDRV